MSVSYLKPSIYAFRDVLEKLGSVAAISLNVSAKYALAS